MNLKKIIFIITAALLITSCSEKDKADSGNESSGSISKIDKSGPFLAVKLSIPNIKTFIERENPEAREETQYKMMVNLIDSLKITESVVFLEAGNPFPTPAIMLTSSEGWKDLDKNPVFGAFLVKESDALYKLKPGTVPPESSAGLGEPVIKIEGSNALITTSKSKSTPGNLLKSTAFNKAKEISMSSQLGSVGCIIPDKVDIKLEELMKGTPAEGNMIAGRIAKVADGILNSFGESFESVDFIALALDITADSVSISLKQQFREDKTGRRTFKVLKGEDKEMDFDMVSDISSGLQNEKLTKNFEYKNGILHSQMSWKKDDTKYVMRGLSKVLMGSMFATADPVATVGKIKTEYGTEPSLLKDVNLIKSKLPEIVKYASFPAKPFPGSNQVTVYFEEIPGFGFTSGSGPLEYEIIECRDTKGNSIPLKKEDDSRFKKHINQFVWVKFQNKLTKDIVPASLKMKVMAEAKPATNIIEFSKSEQKKVKKGNGCVVKLDYIDRDAVKVSHKGEGDIRLIAYDKDGRVLKKKSVNGFVSYNKANYMGEIEKIKVVTFGEPQKIEAVVVLDMKPVILPDGPITVKRSRKGFEHSFIDDFKPESFENLKVTKSNPENKWNRALVIKVEGNPGMKTDWNIMSIKDGQYKNHTKSSSTHNGKVEFYLRDKEFKDQNSFLGIVDFKTKTGVQTFTVDSKAGAVKTVKTVDGKSITLTINKNQLSVDKGDANLINLSVYDDKGTIKQEGTMSRSANGKTVTTYKYWGNIKKVKFQTFSKEIEHSMKFELLEKPSDPAVKGAWAALENHSNVFSTLRKLNTARRETKAKYGENISFLHYSVNLISKEIADADPLGAEMYGYTPKPLKGYRYTLAKGKMDYNGKEILFKPNFTRDGILKVKGKDLKVKFYGSSWSLPFIIATPTDKSLPTYFVNGSTVYWKVVDKEIEYFPSDTKGWKYKNLY